PAAYPAAVRDVFAAAGIPYTLGTAPAIGETRAGRSLRLLAEVRRSDFARATVMEFLAFADLRARPGTSPAEWERLSRQAGIVGGARERRERVQPVPPRARAGAGGDGGGGGRGRATGGGGEMGTRWALFDGPRGSCCVVSRGSPIPRRSTRWWTPSPGRSAAS